MMGDSHERGRCIGNDLLFDPAHLPVPMTKPARQRVADALANCADPILREYDTVEIIQVDE